MNLNLLPNQLLFSESTDPIYCQWFRRGQGGTMAVIMDSIIKTQEEDGNSYIFVNHYRLLPFMRDIFNNLYSPYDLMLSVRYEQSNQRLTITNLFSNNTIMVLTKSLLSRGLFKGYKRVSYIYIDDYLMDYEKEELRQLYERKLKQLKIVGKYE